MVAAEEPLLTIRCTTGVTRLILASALLASCSAAVPTSVTASPSPTATSSSPITFRVGSDQARFVATTVALFDAWNIGDVAAVLAVVTDDVVGGDCDFRAGRPVQWRTKAELADLLRERVRDHDALVLAEIFNENPDPTTGGRVVGVRFARRTSDTLRAVGRPEGIRPEGGAKIVFAPDGRRVVALAIAGPSCPL